MTAIKPGSRLCRETAMYYRGRSLIVCLFPGWLEIREKGRRHAYAVDYLSIHSLGAKKQAERDREERKAARKRHKKEGPK